MAKIVKKGAEGDLFESVWNGRKCLIKERKPKAYRNSDLDYRIRKGRTVRESELISSAKSIGIATPLVYFVDVLRCRIYMQYIQGISVQNLPQSKILNMCPKMGQIVALLHRNGIMHGDLTTSNFIVSGNVLYVIDFGLAQRTTKAMDWAVDLRLFKEILNSAHAQFMEEAWKKFLVGYRLGMGSKTEEILHLVSVIEGRGRYAQVV